jgi:hypothetical protein
MTNLLAKYTSGVRPQSITGFAQIIYSPPIKSLVSTPAKAVKGHLVLLCLGLKYLEHLRILEPNPFGPTIGRSNF